jgi:hypothetical protein
MSGGIGFGLACLSCSLAAAAPGGIPGPVPHSAVSAALGSAAAATGAAATGASAATGAGAAAAAPTGAAGAVPSLAATSSPAAASAAAAPPPTDSASSGSAGEAGPAPSLGPDAAVLTNADFAAINAFLDTAVAIRVGPDGPRPQIRILSAYVGTGGRACRRIQETVDMNDKSVLAWADVCQERSGAWALMPSRP